MIRLSLFAVAAALTSSAFADPLTLEVTANGHGGYRYQYRAVEDPTIAVSAQGRSVGQPTMVDCTELRLESRDDGHGTARQQYVAVK